MKLEDVKKLIALAEEHGLAELEVEDEDLQVRIVRQVAAPVAAAAPAAREAATEAPAASGADVVSAPMAGTFYRASAPGEQSFVEVGTRVAAGDVLCIIESMKMMNRIESDRAGRVLAVLVDNGQPIETGAALFRVA